MTNETQENSASVPAAPASALPLRGLAMVLIAVAVMLGLWALYSFTRPDSADSAASRNAAQSASQNAAQNASQNAGQNTGQHAAQPAAPAASAPQGQPAGQATDQANDQATDAAPAAASAQSAAPGQPATPANSGQAAAQGPVKLVNVLNNSTVQGLAADRAKEIEASGYQLGEVGNFSDEILSETTVFFPAGDADAEASARELAEQLGGVAKENIPALPQAATTQRALTVVLVNQ